MASLDVESLFTNIPLDETINICLKKLFDDEGISNISNLNKSQFKTLLELAVKECYFLCDCKIYKQVDGVAMGNPLGPVLANIFLSYHESRWLTRCPIRFRPRFYVRYVDDTFVFFSHESHVAKFVEYMNNQHANIKFTCEKQVDNRLNFLDVLVEKHGKKVSTSIYRKSTFSGLYSKFSSFIPTQYKTGLIRTLLHRIFNISSSYQIMTEEIDKLKDVLIKNEYPKGLIDKTVSDFFNKKYSDPVATELTCSKLTYNMILPYTGDHGHKVVSKLRNIISTFFPQIKIQFIFKPSLRLQNFFQNKDAMPKSLLSNVIYKYTCSDCSIGYIGETRRHFGSRIAEHTGISFATKKPIIGDKFSAIQKHISMTGHSTDASQFKIVCRASTQYDLLIKESLHIARDRPALNNNISSFPLNLF